MTSLVEIIYSQDLPPACVVTHLLGAPHPREVPSDLIPHASAQAQVWAFLRAAPVVPTPSHKSSAARGLCHVSFTSLTS